MIPERVKAGLARAKAKGVRLGLATRQPELEDVVGILPNLQRR